ncbi:MFS transporter [Zooshikella harenae]|uniref:MFS transporter n=1 Tax=Zooshikella harenae TaxID=2827238 RepID=A0ABS5ZF24_9GAMM|nr:MFS transporter [Zooshikella harenae]MBU2712671.1 MFS transporter [Zooshikella harenae]
MSSPSAKQAPLIKSKRFLPFFMTQFLGAFNDNVFRNSLALLIGFQLTRFESSLPFADNKDILINLAAVLFILPLFIFSATAGQLADKYEKSKLIRIIKFSEIIIMSLAALAFYFNSLIGLLLVLFLMGTQSSFFGPVKYAIIPQHLQETELVAGNAWVELGTFVAILLGTILGGLLTELPSSTTWISYCIIGFATFGYLSSRQIPHAPSSAPNLHLNWNPITQTFRTLRYARETRAVYLSILAISWFWFLGIAYLTQLPNFTSYVINGNPNIWTCLLASFSIGIGLGSLSCDRLSGHKIELGIVPIGSIGLTLFGIDLFLVSHALPPHNLEEITIISFFSITANLRILIDLALIGFFGGLFIVPLYALVQSRTDEAYRARVIAANNILNALFMLTSGICAIICIGLLKLSIPQFFLILALSNGLVAIYVFSVVPEFTMRFLIYLLSHSMYRVKSLNLDRIPETGPAVIVCNHVSYVDALLIAGACRRPIRFVMDKPIYDLPVLNFIFRVAKAIPITAKSRHPETFNQAFDRIAEELEQGNVVCIFPEGRLTKTGEINTFKRGIEKIISRTPVPVIPMALQGLWGSFFSHHGGPAMAKRPRRVWSRIKLVTGHPISAENATAERLQQEVAQLRGEYA